MAAQHTPGPWIFHAQGDANEFCLLTAEKRWVIGFRQNGEILTPEQEANARLISAAPELLAIAKKYHGWDDPLHIAARVNCPECAAITKAEGTTK